jgi:hypothetical protein
MPSPAKSAFGHHGRRPGPTTSPATSPIIQTSGTGREALPTDPITPLHQYKGLIHSDRKCQDIEERILRQVQQVRVERPAPKGPWQVDQSQEVGNSRSRHSPSPAPTEGSDKDIITVSPLSRNHYNFLDAKISRQFSGDNFQIPNGRICGLGDQALGLCFANGR